MIVGTRGAIAYATTLVALAALAGWALATRVQERGPGEAPAYYVAPGGDDDDPGTEDAPWRTIQKAADTAVPGSTVYVGEGVYRELVTIHVSGSETGGYITFRNLPGETPVLDGDGLEVPTDFGGMISIDSQSYVAIRGFEIRNYRTAEPGHGPVGIWVTGSASHIRIVGNSVHDLGTDVRSRSGGDAHGIAVYGTNSVEPIQDVVIQGNELFNLSLGSSESLVLNGNVRGFLIADNVIHDNDNIGIDIIGFEGKADDPSVDQARDGVVSGNLIYNIDSYGNPAYGEERSADGIYVDGGRDLIIEGNVVHDVNIGIELASEHRGRSTSFVTARNNLVFSTSVISLAIGGYDRKRGSTENCVIVNNTFYQSAGVELLVQFDTRDNVIANNIVFAGPGGGFLRNPYVENEGNVVDNNVYYSAAGSDLGTWQWKGRSYGSFEAYREATGNDRHSRFADPGFVDAPGGDFRLEATSPAIDAGAYLAQAGSLDLGGSPRAENGVLDVGAYERPAPPPSPTPSLAEPVLYASDLGWVSASNGWGPVERDMSNGEKKPGDGGPITIGGQIFEKGIGAHAPSAVVIDLGGTCTAFEADVGLDDETKDKGSVIFQVFGDGRKLVDSGVVRGTQDARPLYADLTGVAMLELRVTGAGDGIDFDHADWGNARLACAG